MVQFIENTFYQWQEYSPEHSAGLCIYMIAPQPSWLSRKEARVLLSGSRLWNESVVDLSEAEILDALDPRLNVPPAEPSVQPHEADILRPKSEAVEGNDTPVYFSLPAPQSGQAPSIGIERQRESDIQQETVQGTDERKRVEDTMVYPWNTIAFISNQFPDGERFRGTGFLVGPHMILTNGHVVYDHERGGFVQSLELAPGQSQPREGADVIRPFGSRQAEHVSTNQGYVDAVSEERSGAPYDYAAVFFSTSFAQISTFMPLEFNYEPRVINLAGYPSEAQGEPSRTMWHSSGDVVEIDSRVVHYLADSSGGNSGGPVWA